VEQPGEQMTFAHTIESGFRSLGGLLTPALRAKICEMGIDPDKPLLPAYPRAMWEAVLGVIAHELHPAASHDEAHRLVGRRISRGYNETNIGRAVAESRRVRGPEHALKRMRQTLRSGNNYAETRLAQVGERAFELWVNETNGSPGYIQGVLETVMENAGVKAEVLVQSFDGHAATYLIRW
jgi:uncharacterized protein (TIGR02265 family)